MSVYSPLPPEPPPPPPPLPIISPSSTRSSATSPSNLSSSNIIKPTTAGLLKFPSLQQQRQESPNGFSPTMNLSSQEFKDELREKQSRFSNINSSISIDERIQARKELDDKLTFGSASLEEQQMANLPDKLLSTLNRQDVKPFSYISGVNDPNNRGKLDLNQIKSPIMRRRLLANLDSVEREDGEVDILAPSSEPNDLYLPECATIKYYQPKPIESFVKTQKHQAPIMSPPVMQYNEPPLFYNVKQPASGQVSDTIGSTRPKSALDELDDEVVRSLDSFSELVANLHTTNPRQTIRQHDAPLFHKQNHQNSDLLNQVKRNEHSIDGRRSTFLPNDIYDRNSDSLRQSSSSPAYHYSQTRSMGDYLLSPDSNYFSTNSSTQPYSISPYYGSPLDIERYEQPFNSYPQARLVPGRTFSPDNGSSSPCDRPFSNGRYY